MDINNLIPEEKANLDCIFFKGHKPCKYHKKEGVHCNNCIYYKPFNKKFLILKRGGMGAVVRATPILHKINEEFPNSKIFWLTDHPDLVPKQDNIFPLKYSLESISIIKNIKFDFLFSFDKDLDSCSLAKELNADVKKGFSQKDGVIIPFDKDAEPKFRLGLFDDLMKLNKKKYGEDIFELCGFKWCGEKYISPEYEIFDLDLKSNKKIIGIQTGTSGIYKTRDFSKEKLLSFISLLTEKYEVILLGGPNEDSLNKELSEKTQAKYLGVFPLKKFVGLVSLCDLIITPVTLTLHLAISLNKKIILTNNVLPDTEFYLYGLGITLEPEIPCKRCYKTKFDENCIKKNCMDLIPNQKIIESVDNLLNQK